MRFILCFLTFFVLPANGRSEELASPFVAGFDRFARHGEIDASLAGRLLLSELSCTACHRATGDSLQPKGGPRLDGIGDRVSRNWIKRFLMSPQVTKPGTTMPDMLAALTEKEKTRIIDALIAFLGSLHEPYPVMKASGKNPVPLRFWTKGNGEMGKRLFHQVGCVACHEPDGGYDTVETKTSPVDQLLKQLDPDEIAEMGLASIARRVNSVPLGDLATKYSRKSLTFFLLDPHVTRSNGRMPNLKLSAIESADIAAYLLQDAAQQQNAEKTSSNVAMIREGRRQFERLRCSNCHSVGSPVANENSKPLAALNVAATRNCLGSIDRSLPSFRLDKSQVTAIRAALAAYDADAKIEATQRIRFMMLQLNCYACHERDKQGGIGRYRKAYFETAGHVDLGDEGRLPPPLTGVGGKLRVDWLGDVFKGDKTDVRPHLQIRMPEFPTDIIGSLPKLFARADLIEAHTESEVFGRRAEQPEAGRALLDLGCVECHPVRGESLPGVVGVDLNGITGRVHPRWFRDFLLNPGLLKPRTRMPTFFPNGLSQNKELLGGDAHRQIAAIWTYLKDLEKHPLPEKIQQARNKDFELIPKGRPILLRTFMQEAGTHAIAVGFPQKVHFAFDAEKLRLAQAWRGRFLDAQGTWFERFAPPANPLGDALINMPNDLPLAMLESEEQAWTTAAADAAVYRFDGYRLDDTGTPTFLYHLGEFEIEDRIEPTDDLGLRRRMTIKNRNRGKDTPLLWFRANVGMRLRRDTASTYTNSHGLTTTISNDIGDLGVLRKQHGAMEWIIPVEVGTKKTLEVQYKW